MQREHQEVIDTKKSATCIANHLTVLQMQTHKEQIADSSEACNRCSYSGICNHSWIDNARPLLTESEVKVSLLVPNN